MRARLTKVAAALTAVGALAVGGAALAGAANPPAPAPAPATAVGVQQGDQTAPERHFQQVILPSRGDTLLRAAERLSRRRARRAARSSRSDSQQSQGVVGKGIRSSCLVGGGLQQREYCAPAASFDENHRSSRVRDSLQARGSFPYRGDHGCIRARHLQRASRCRAPASNQLELRILAAMCTNVYLAKVDQPPPGACDSMSNDQVREIAS